MKKISLFIVMSIFLMLITLKNSIGNVVICSCAIILIAIVLSEFTSIISDNIGEKKGGLIAATLGNIPELVIGIWSIKYGMVKMVKAALVGSIISNILLVLGVAVFLGGIKFKEQNFNKIIARTNYNMLFMAMSSMIVLASLNKYNNLKESTIFNLSLSIAIMLIIIYILGLIFSLYTHSNLFLVSENSEEEVKAQKGNKNQILIGIAISTILLYFISEKLILNVRNVVSYYNISQEFLGIVIIPLLGNIGENMASIISALKNKINLSIEIAIGSSIQITLFVTPILIVIAFLEKAPMTFLFSGFQIVASAIAMGMSFFVFADGKSYWFEGAILIAIYIIITLAFYFV